MNRIRITAVVTAFLCCIQSCRKFEYVAFSVSVEDVAELKSSFDGNDRTVNQYKVFVYRDGAFVDSRYWNGGDPPSFLLPAAVYDFYVLCNAGDVPSLGASPDSWRYTVTDASAMFSGGIPMAGKCTKLISSTTSSLSIEVTRLVSKYNLYVQRNFEDTNSAFTVSGVRVCQAAADALAFWGGSVPGSVLGGAGGDCASPADLSVLNSDTSYNGTTGPVTFYMLENARGTLLGGNSDPWKKCCDRNGGLLPSADSQECTYLEVSGTWTTSGASESISYRMFLGQDNCSDFDVLRNTESNVTLILSDAGKERNSWKVQNVTDYDTRSFEWSVPSLDIGSAGAFEVELSPNPPDMVFGIYYASDPSSPSWQKLTAISSGHIGYNDVTNKIRLDFDTDRRKLDIVNAEDSADSAPFTFVLMARTTDGKVSSTLTVIREIAEYIIVISTS